MTLDDAFNYTLYSWDLVEPAGEIYAVNDSKLPLWDQVMCFNLSQNAAQNVTITELETSLGMGVNDVDGVNETFNHTFAGTFQVGSSVAINKNSGCRSVSLYVNDGYSGMNFNETILTDNTSNENVIYVSLLEPSSTGFQGSPVDFEMIVGENGDTAPASTYYFYVELT